MEEINQANTSGKEEGDLKTSLSPLISTINTRSDPVSRTTNVESHSFPTEEEVPSSSSYKITQDDANTTNTAISTQGAPMEIVQKSRCTKRTKRTREGKLHKTATCKQLKRKGHTNHKSSSLNQHLQKNRQHKQRRKHFNIRFGMRRNYRLLKRESNEKTTDTAFSGSRTVNANLHPGDSCGPSSCSQDNSSNGYPSNMSHHSNSNSSCSPCCCSEMNSTCNECQFDSLSPCTEECCENLSSPCSPNCSGNCSPSSCTDSLCYCSSPCTPDCHVNTTCPCSPDCSCFNESPSMEEEI